MHPEDWGRGRITEVTCLRTQSCAKGREEVWTRGWGQGGMTTAEQQKCPTPQARAGRLPPRQAALWLHARSPRPTARGGSSWFFQQLSEYPLHTKPKPTPLWAQRPHQ